MRIAGYGRDGRATVHSVDSGPALRAARCSVGAMGIVLEVTLACVPQYYVRERCVWREALDAVLDRESAAPMQQFYILPHTWAFLVHERRVAAVNRRAGAAALYRAYWLVLIDVALHLGVKVAAGWLGSRRLVRTLYTRILPAFIFPRWRVTDRSDRQLLMRHDLFRHLEMEAFVPRDRLREALAFVVEVLRAADDADHVPSAEVRGDIEAVGEWEAFAGIRGAWSHHYPICVRRLRPDDTLISMASCHGMEDRDWYAISLITFTEPRTGFRKVAGLLAVVMAARFGARPALGQVVSARRAGGGARLSGTGRVPGGLRGARSGRGLSERLRGRGAVRPRLPSSVTIFLVAPGNRAELTRGVAPLWRTPFHLGEPRR